MTIWNATLALWFFIAAFLPATLTPQIALFDLPVSASDLALFAAALVCCAAFLCAGSALRAPRWHRNLGWCFAALLVYAAVSTLWSGLDQSNRRAMLYTLVAAAAAFALPFSAIAALPAEGVRPLVRAAAFAAAAAGALYSLESFFSLGLRSELGQFYSVGFGIERVKGPLFQSSTGHVVLLPAAAFLAQDLLTQRTGRFFKLLAAAVLAISILGLGSRAAAALLGLLVTIVVLAARGIPHRAALAAGLLGGTALAATVVFAYAGTERLQSFQDPRRIATHDTALRAIEQRDLDLNLRGAGYGAFWPWYLPDMELADLIARGADMRTSDYGDTLYQPHSVLLVLAVELGLAGMVFFCKLWATLGSLLWNAWKQSRDFLFAAAVAVTSLSMFGDLIIFKNPKVSAFWWFYLLAALAMLPARRAQENAA